MRKGCHVGSVWDLASSEREEEKIQSSLVQPYGGEGYVEGSLTERKRLPLCHRNVSRQTIQEGL